jgi:hypothetical protein
VAGCYKEATLEVGIYMRSRDIHMFASKWSEGVRRVLEAKLYIVTYIVSIVMISVGLYYEFDPN